MNTVDFNQIAASWAYAHGKPELSGQLRSIPEDFIVIEQLSFELSGQGEHIYLYIEKRELNTTDVVHVLSRFTGVKANRISYAGLKDKHALTTQWFSIYISGFAEPDWSQFDNDKIKIQQITRHNKKLKRGAIKSNQFSIVLRSVQGNTASLDHRLNKIQKQGVPNYFGEQRFGRNFQNLTVVQEMVAGKKIVKNRHLRGLYYSAARSFLFNELLSQRVHNGNWHTAIDGDVMSLDGSRSFFDIQEVTAEIIDRLQRNDIHPSGPLTGAGESKATLDALKVEQQCLQGFTEWQDWLASERVDASRRALRLIPRCLQWQWKEQDQLQLSFEAPSGSYATSILREMSSIVGN